MWAVWFGWRSSVFERNALHSAVEWRCANLADFAIDCNRVCTCFDEQPLARGLTLRAYLSSTRENGPQSGQLHRRGIAIDQSQLLASRLFLVGLNQADGIMQTHFMLTAQTA